MIFEKIIIEIMLFNNWLKKMEKIRNNLKKLVNVAKKEYVRKIKLLLLI
jgi:hypothetical protein